MAISIAIYTPRLVSKPNHPICVLNIFFCVSPHWLVTWHCMYSRLYHIMIFIKLNDMFTQKYYCHKKCIFELVIFETLIMIEHKKSKNTSLTMITYIFFHRTDISNLQYWWLYVWNQERINANMICSETLNVLRARLRRLTD